MMQSILDRTREQNQAQEQDEDRSIERMLKHIAQEQEFVEQVRASHFFLSSPSPESVAPPAHSALHAPARPPAPR